MNENASADTMGNNMMEQDTSSQNAMAMNSRSGLNAEYADLDQNGDKKVTSDEFRNGLQSQQLYDSWDLNNDAEITEDEFNDGSNVWHLTYSHD